MLHTTTDSVTKGCGFGTPQTPTQTSMQPLTMIKPDEARTETHETHLE